MKPHGPIVLSLALLAPGYASATEAAMDSPVPAASNAQLQWSRSLAPNIRLRESTRSDPAVRPSAQAPSADATTPAAGLPPKRVDPVGNWAILMSDKTLYRTMRRWAQEANYQLLWQIDRDYPIEANLSFQTDFRGAVEQIMAGVALTDYPLQALINPSARVLRVVRHMDEERR